MRVSGDDREVRLAGVLDVRAAADVRMALHEAVDGGEGDLVVDLGDVTGLDPTGLGVLVGAHRRAGRRERRIVLRSVTPPVHRMLVATRLHRILAMEHRTSRQQIGEFRTSPGLPQPSYPSVHSGEGRAAPPADAGPAGRQSSHRAVRTHPEVSRGEPGFFSSAPTS